MEVGQGPQSIMGSTARDPGRWLLDGDPKITAALVLYCPWGLVCSGLSSQPLPSLGLWWCTWPSFPRHPHGAPCWPVLSLPGRWWRPGHKGAFLPLAGQGVGGKAVGFVIVTMLLER